MHQGVESRVATGPFKETTATLGQLLRRWREEKNLSLRDFAKQSNLSPTFVSNVEIDQIKPAASTLKLWLDQLDVNNERRTLAFFRAGKFPEDILERALASSDNFQRTLAFVRQLPEHPIDNDEA